MRFTGVVQLVKAFLSGPQDLSFADLANDVSRRLWEGLGGFVSIVHSLYWTQPLRPARFNAAKSAHGLVARSLATGWRPGSWAIDRLSASWHPVDGLQGTPLTATVMATHADEVFDCIGLRAEYDERSTEWLLRQVAARRDLGELRGVALRDQQGTVVGWHLYYVNAGGVGQVVQVAARKERYGDVLDSLFYDAWRIPRTWRSRRMRAGEGLRSAGPVGAGPLAARRRLGRDAAGRRPSVEARRRMVDVLLASLVRSRERGAVRFG